MSDNNFTKNSDQPANAPRINPPVFFYIMLVLSMINAGITVISSIMLGFSSPTIVEMYENGSLTLPEQMSDVILSLKRIPQYYYFISAVFWALSFYGALAMWKLRKTGFHCYTLAQLILLLIPLVILGESHVALGNIMFTILFIAYYATIVIFWKKRQEQSQQFD